MTYPKTFTSNSFIQQDNGQYKATITADTHGLGTNYRVTKILRYRGSSIWENMIASYKILANGDFELYVDEAFTCKVYLVGDE